MGPVVEYVRCTECDADIPVAFDANEGGGNLFSYCSKCGAEYAVSIAIKYDLKISRLEFR